MTPTKIFVRFADNGNIRKISKTPFEGGIEYSSEVAKLVRALEDTVSFLKDDRLLRDDRVTNARISAERALASLKLRGETK